MVERGIHAQTNKVHALIRQCFAYAVAEERVAVNPALGIGAPAEQKARTRVLADGELKALWGALIDPAGLTKPHKPGETPKPLGARRGIRITLQLAMLLLVRRGEVAGMRTDELDLEQGVWLIPGERMKGGLPHAVPLSARAVALIEEALKLRKDKTGAQVFQSFRGKDQPLLPNSVTHAMREITDALEIKGASPHDLRRTGSTLMTSERLGISPFIRSRVLAHRGDTGGGSAVSMVHYDANDYIAEKRRALEAWEGLLLNITEARAPASNVARLEARRP
jgi:integrase